MDNRIIYNNESKEIQFHGDITSFVFYNELLLALREHYKDNGVKKVPLFSFMHVNYFDPLVVPNLIGIGYILKSIHKGERTPLLFARIDSTKFLDEIWFFDNVGKPKTKSEIIGNIVNGQIYAIENNYVMGEDLYDFDPRYLGFYNNQNQQNLNNLEHKVRIYDDDSYSYYKEFKTSTSEELDAIRTDKFNDLKPFIEKHFRNIISKINDERQIKTILKVITEIVCNSVLYSGSSCAAMLQSRNNKTIISISDFGVGFEYSLNKKKEKFGYEYNDILKKFPKEDQVKYKNYLYIFETLEYSKKKSVYRENLYTLLHDVALKMNGKMRIHYNDTQVIFTSNRCNHCTDINPIECSKCLLQSYSEDKYISPVRFFNSKYQGVHIEVEFNF
ncbi:hypothetical protein SDC9_15841 [bioreactor metagenome]|uniref:Uncharacterized protein n=1 Tax=bioreactor metagenome TaxID=1076179 RepID=A0A644TT72_9ZZZZ